MKMILNFSTSLSNNAGNSLLFSWLDNNQGTHVVLSHLIKNKNNIIESKQVNKR